MTTSQAKPVFFFFNDTATTEIYTLSLHDALPIYRLRLGRRPDAGRCAFPDADGQDLRRPRPTPPRLHQGKHTDRKSTRLNSSHVRISYAAFCLKKKRPWRCLYNSES